MVIYFIIGFCYIFAILSYYYLFKDEVITIEDLVKGFALIFIWPIIILMNLWYLFGEYKHIIILNKRNKHDE